MGFGIGIGIGWPNASAGISYVKKLIKAFKARVLSYPNSIFEAEACLDATLEGLNTKGLLDNASLIITPNAYNEGILYDVVPNTTLGDMTVVRATTATRVNSAGLIEVVPRNLLTYSEQFENANWVKERITITANATTAPNGFLTADKIVEDTTTNSHRARQNTTSEQGVQYTLSYYLKASERTKTRISVGGLNAFANFDLSNGTIIGAPTLCTASIIEANNGWYRCSITYTQTSVTSTTTLHLAATLNSEGDFSYLGDGVSGIFVWGAQLEAGSTATEYFPTTTRLNIPRIDYTNGSCPSLLIEPQRTNLVLRSEEFNNAIWTKINSSVNENTSVAPDGNNTADEFVPNGTNSLRQTIVFANATYSISFYVKENISGLVAFNIVLAGTAGSSVIINFTNGNIISSGVNFISGESINVGNGWYRIKVILVNTYVGATTLRIEARDSGGSNFSGDGVNGVYIWGAQLEAGSYPTSYIPTIASTVTRNADVISKTGISSLIGQTEGAIFVDLYSPFDGTSKEISLSDGTLLNRISIGFLNQVNRFTIQVIKNNITQVSNTFVSVNQDIRNKIVLSYEQNNYKLYINGVLSLTDTLAETFTNELSILQLNRGNAQNPYFGNVNSIQLYKTALTDQECINLTTL